MNKHFKKDMKDVDEYKLDTVPQINENSGDWGSLMLEIIGFGKDSIRKNYYPQFESSIVELRKKEEYFRALIEYTSDIITVVDENGIITYASPAIMEILGRYIDEVIGKSIFSFVHPEDIINAVTALKQSIDSPNKTVWICGRISHKSGEWVDFEALVNNQLSNPSVGGIIINARNISEQRQAEKKIIELNEELRDRIQEKTQLLNQVMEYDKLKTEFIGNMSHEFRTPVSVILSTLQLLESTHLNNSFIEQPQKLDRHIEVMKRNCFRMIRLIDNFIDITKIDSNYIQLNIKSCEVVGIIRNIVLSVAEYAGNKGINLEFGSHIEEKLIACDLDKIEKIMLNLISNAIKFTEPGGRINVNVYEQGEYVAIEVKDTGIGIPGDKQAYIFDRFAQVDKSFTRKNEGSGIGLSLVKSFVEMHKGSIHLESEYGKGSTFMVKLPAANLAVDECCCTVEPYNRERVERIQVEFSDIY